MTDLVPTQLIMVSVSPAEFAPWQLARLKGRIEQALREESLTGTVTAERMATDTQEQDARDTEEFDVPGISLHEHPVIRLNGEGDTNHEEDGAFVSAWLWVPGMEQPVTMDRLRIVRTDRGWDEETYTDEVLRRFLEYVHAQHSPDANISRADLEDLLDQFEREVGL